MPIKRMPFSTIFARLCLLMATAFSCASAQAGTWVWLDDSGRKIFSDLPPPSSVPDARILQQPGRSLPSASALSPKAASAAPEQPKANTGKAKGEVTADPAALKKEQEKKKAAEAERQAQEEKNAQIRAENCRRAQTSMRTLESGIRMVSTDDNGNQVVLNDEMRAAEAQRLQAAIQANCN